MGKGQGYIEKERRGKGKGRRHDEMGGRKVWGIRMGGGGIAPLLLGGIDATGYRYS